MENFYSKVIYDVMQLIFSKQYKRAIVLCNFLIDKGFKTTELIIVLSYAYKNVEGTDKALEVLRDFAQKEKDPKQKQGCSSVKSPLIDLALTEYNLQSKRFQQALKSLQQFELLNHQAEQSNSSSLIGFLKQLKDNYVDMFQSSHNKNHLAKENASKPYIQSSLSLVQGFRNQINRITEAYLLVQSASNGHEFDPSQIAIRYGQFYIQYDEIKQKILSILSNQLKVQSQNLFKVKTTNKKGQIITNADRKFKKPHSKQIFFQQTRPMAGNSVQKKKLFKMSENNLLPVMDRSKQSEISQVHLQELQILLVQVNRFISFFKNRLKNYSASRIKEFSPSKINQISDFK